MEMKKLRFHTPNAEGKSKCHKLHVGKKSAMCPELRVHGVPMENVKSDKYLGDIIAADGSNSENIRNRVSKGNGIIAKIKAILGNVSLGESYFRIAFLLRESMFLSSILFSSECWYGLKSEEIEELEKLDRILLKFIFNVPDSVPSIALYLESGCLTIGTLIKARRVNFLHTLANREDSEMHTKFFQHQWDHPSKLDWTEQVRKDLLDLGMPVI